MQYSAKPSRRVVRFRTVVVNEHHAKPPVAKEGTAERTHIWRCQHPARRFQVELAELLQGTILRFGKQFDAEGGGLLDGTPARLVLFARVQRRTIIAETPSFFRTFGRTVAERETPLSCRQSQ